ncbi:hypothetical protein P872_00295 [Rhodonellum psychrophilum GCM71 = DSM 17998]|uniref:Uncharacterized protein n=1 Tax=Rhodonellum psychrophilum GCM71 = DSM 17998 TaxID=1123057 RepID=U5C164_9BACT|nr:hypothetical protein P872_00295 [Rhodonellum psychrophilum GCM71 = DSM 17998]
MVLLQILGPFEFRSKNQSAERKNAPTAGLTMPLTAGKFKSDRLPVLIPWFLNP